MTAQIQLRLMTSAPHDSEIIIVTACEALVAEWDVDFSNFWSKTAERALTQNECLGWLKKSDWISQFTVQGD